jgi:hypothetical protein
MTEPRNPFLEFRARYEGDAVRFVQDVLGMDGRDAHLGADAQHVIDKEQIEVLEAISKGERRISIRSGHGVGKTTVLSWAIVWHNVCKYPQRTVGTAATSGQLFDALASETVRWLKKLPKPLVELFEIQAEGFYLRASPENSFTRFKTSRAETPEALAGVHAEEGSVLLVADEGSGVPDEVYESASGSMSGRNAITIIAGNPVRKTGFFHDTQTKLSDMWRTIHISCVGHRRIAQDFIDDMKRRYGEDSNAYRVRVLGEFPKSDNDAIVPFDLMEMALTRDVKPVNVKPIWGVDVGGGGKGGDRSTLAKRKGNVLMEKVKSFDGLEPMQLCGRIKQEWDTTPVEDRPSSILVDSIGLGASVATRLMELDLPARGINVGENPAMRDQYVNLKAELWIGKVREWVMARDCNLCDDRELGVELCGVNYMPPTSAGKSRVESKADTRKRLGRSPDLAEAFLMTFGEEAVSAMFGGGGTSSWKEPLRREIRCLV